jgi:hypothetical protein
MSVTVFGIRHHGPGSARSLREALRAQNPDVILIEGPPDANDLIALAADAQMSPPVALLIYLPNEPRGLLSVRGVLTGMAGDSVWSRPKCSGAFY